MMTDLFTDAFLKEIGFSLISRTKSEFSPFQIYGKAQDRTGMTIISWNEEGASCTYFGDKLTENNCFCIEKDGGTRTAFNGYVFSQNDVKALLNLTW